jgi:hypothetical protein
MSSGAPSACGHCVRAWICSHCRGSQDMRILPFCDSIWLWRRAMLRLPMRSMGRWTTCCQGAEGTLASASLGQTTSQYLSCSTDNTRRSFCGVGDDPICQLCLPPSSDTRRIPIRGRRSSQAPIPPLPLFGPSVPGTFRSTTRDSVSALPWAVVLFHTVPSIVQRMCQGRSIQNPTLGETHPVPRHGSKFFRPRIPTSTLAGLPHHHSNPSTRPWQSAPTDPELS